MTSPAISVIIPTFNRRQLLAQTLNSIRCQSFTDWEALVIDDGSNDGTQEMLQEINLVDARIKYIKRNHQKSGACVCRNEGTHASQGQYIIYLDSDDCLAPKALENRFQEMENRPDLDFGVFPCVLFREQPGDMRLLWNADTDENDIDRFLALETPWQTTSPIWRRKALVQLGDWDEQLPSLQDWEFHLRAVILNLKYDRFSMPDCFWRVSREESISRKSKSTEHPKAYERLFCRTQQMLLNAGLLTNHRRILLGGIYFWLTESWIDRGEIGEALRVWKLCYENDLISKSYYLQGKFYFQFIANTHPKIYHLGGKFLELIWPKGLAFKWSKSYRKTSLPTSFDFSQLNLSSVTE